MAALRASPPDARLTAEGKKVTLLLVKGFDQCSLQWHLNKTTEPPHQCSWTLSNHDSLSVLCNGSYDAVPVSTAEEVSRIWILKMLSGARPHSSRSQLLIGVWFYATLHKTFTCIKSLRQDNDNDAVFRIVFDT